jgi:hypothetical protein
MHRRGYTGIICLAAAAIGAFARPAAAQTTAAQLLGSVTDPSGAAIERAVVSAVNDGTNDTRKATTDSAGNYLFPQLPVGRYTLSVELPGFQRYVVSGIDLKVDDRRREDVVMKVGEVTQEVTVAASAVAVNSSNAAIGEVISEKPIVELPLNGRNFLQLAQLTPGTIPPVLQNGEDTTSSFNGNRSNLSVGISGTREVSAAYLFDGVLGREEYYAAVSIQPVLESIAEFKIMRGYFAPEYGSPAIVSVVTKSGTNQYHGGVWEFLRNDKLDARNTFDYSGTKPPFRQNQFGGSLGGPIRKDKLFFQVDTELLRSRQSTAQNLFVPTTAMLQGNFSGFRTIYDPNTADLSKVKQPFPGNVIPADRIGPFANLYNKFLLTSAVSPLAPSAVSSGLNLFGTQGVNTDENKWDARIDYNISSKDKIFGRITYDQTDETVADLRPGASRIYPLHSRNAVISWSRTFSPSVINDVRLGWDRAFLHAGGPQPGGNPDWPAFFGLHNISTTPECSGVPIISAQEYGGWGFPSGSCINVKNNNIFVFDNASIVKGRHNITFGGELERVNLRHLVAFNPQGNFTFTGQFTQGFDGQNLITNSGNAIADYLLGWVASATGQAKVSPMYRRGWWWALHVNDDVKVSQNLTLNIGLRYQVDEPLTEKYNNISDFDFATAKQRFAGQNGVPNGLYNTYWKAFAPRIGVAWRPFHSDRTAIRASYGIFYDRLPGNDQSWQGISPPLNVGANFVTPDPVLPSINIVNLFPTPDLSQGLPNGQFLFNLVGRRDPYLQQWTVSLQQSLAKDLLLEISYVGSHGGRLSKRYDRNVDPTLLLPGDTRTAQQRRPYPNLGFILSDEGAGFSKYNALQSSLRKAYGNGLTFMVSHMWGRSMDNDSYDGKATRFYRPGDNDWGRSIFDIRQRFVLSINYELPFAKHAKGLVRQVAGGWQLNSITALQTGLPFHVTATDRSNTATSFGGRPNRLCNGNLPADQRSPQKWFDTSCFVESQLNTYGNGGVHYLDTDGNKNQDLGVFKNFRITEAKQLQFRYEAFNLFNNVNYNRPNMNISSASTFGKVTGAQAARIMQFGMKLNW